MIGGADVIHTVRHHDSLRGQPALELGLTPRAAQCQIGAYNAKFETIVPGTVQGFPQQVKL